MKIGMIGAGNIASALAEKWASAGHSVMMSNSRGPESLAAHAENLGATAGTAEEAATFGDVLLISVPLKSFPNLPFAAIGSKIVMDTCNYYPNRDGIHPEFEQGGETTSQALQAVISQAQIVKAFNSIMVADLRAGGGPMPEGQRHALPVASDQLQTAERIFPLVQLMGLEPVYAGTLAESWRFERARPVYCRPLSKEALISGLAATLPTDFVAENSWKRG